ncbi:MAG: LysM peptidoglycan-binding domain-containing protein [Phycisphaerae bacterium]|nr:LysM peptidoglycan-binding domain-containing protein [Phycisphaerae bacterium]
MPNIPSMPSIPGGGTRAQKAAQLRAKMEAKKKTTEQEAKAAKSGAEWHAVKSGETLESIATQYGVSPDDIWNDPLNKQIRTRRGDDPAKLQEQDALFIRKPQAQPDAEPVGQGDYVVRAGDCMSSIAKKTGHFWKKVWNDPNNSELKEVRKEPNVLLPKDRVTIPEIETKQEPGETEMRHRFVRRGEPAKLRMQICIEDEPVGNARYNLYIDSHEEEGTTDADGWVETKIPGNAKRGRLVVDAKRQALVFPLNLGGIDPVESNQGVQQRLSNLGYSCGSLDGKLGPKSKTALKRFQVANSHPNPNGEPDEQTRNLLKEKHGS